MDKISFISGRDRCAAWHFDAIDDAFAGTRGVPCVVMAPGFAGTRDTSALMDYARGFAAVRGEIREYPIDHADVDTEAVHQRLLEDQLDFLGRHLSSSASRRATNTTTDWSRQ